MYVILTLATPGEDLPVIRPSLPGGTTFLKTVCFMTYLFFNFANFNI